MRVARLTSALLALTLVAACADGRSTVSADATTTSTRRTTTTARRVTTTSMSTATTTTVTPATAPATAPEPSGGAPRPPGSAPAPTEPPVTEPPPPPPPDPPANPQIQTVTAADLPHSWRQGCPVPPSRLRRILVTYLGFDGADHTGELIVHADWAEALLGVFAQIRAAGFPIERMESVDNYGASDDASMAANNTSAFNCRAVTDGTSWSRHSYGRAIDINPIQNPYVRCNGTFEPPASGDYVHDRSPRQGVITDGDAVVQAFAAIGWQWGGHWTCPSAVDYQHFDRR